MLYVYSGSDPEFANVVWEKIPENDDVDNSQYDDFMLRMLASREAYTRAYH